MGEEVARYVEEGKEGTGKTRRRRGRESEWLVEI